MRLLKKEDREETIAFYANHNIGWLVLNILQLLVDLKRGSLRKLASELSSLVWFIIRCWRFFFEAWTMAYVSNIFGKHPAYISISIFLALSLKLPWLVAEGAKDLAEEYLDGHGTRQIFEETWRQFKPWGANGKFLRMGEIILIIDSATVVPDDCFRGAARVSRCSYYSAWIWYDPHSRLSTYLAKS